MRKGRCSQMWDHTASILTLLININLDPKKGKAVDVEMLHPYTAKKQESGVVITSENVHLLRDAFIPHGRQNK